MSRPIEYPLEIVDAAQKITNAASALNALIQKLRTDKAALDAVSGGNAAGAFNEVFTAFNNSGINNNERLTAVAKAADQSHLQMTEFDRYMANQFRGGYA